MWTPEGTWQEGRKQVAVRPGGRPDSNKAHTDKDQDGEGDDSREDKKD